MNYLEDACECVDAAVFSGDLLFNDKQRSMLKDYLGRWNRAVQRHEGAVDLDRMRAALQQLTVLVRGECPSLLNEDSGGNASLSIEIDECLSSTPR